MNSIVNHPREWRIALLVLLVMAFIGPWVFDKIYMPAEYECNAPKIRLEGDFCGIPMSGFRFYSWISAGYVPFITGLVKGEFALAERFRELIFFMLLLLPLLPIISTLLLIRRGNRPRTQVFTTIAWLLVIGFSLFWARINYPIAIWSIWGIWILFGAAVCGLIMEIIALRKRDPQAVTKPKGSVTSA